jgi:hypothetical protein
VRRRGETGDCLSGLIGFPRLGRLSRRLDHTSTSPSPVAESILTRRAAKCDL